MQDADQHGGEIGPRDAAEPADDHHDEGLGDHRHVHMQVHRLARKLERPAEPGQHRAEGEDRGEEQALVDAERPDHLAVLRRGPDQRAPARLLEQEPEQPEHHRADRDQEELISREAVVEQDDEAPETRRARPELVLRPPARQRQILQHEHDAEGRQQLEKLGRLIDPAQDRHLDRNADQPDQHRCQQHATPKAKRAGRAEMRDQRPGEIGAQHVERAMREIHDPRHAEDDRQSRRDQEERGGRSQPVQRLGEDEVDHADSAPSGSVRRRRRNCAVILGEAKRRSGIHRRTQRSTMDPGSAPLRGLSRMTAADVRTVRDSLAASPHPAGRNAFTSASLGRYFAPSA